MTRETSAEIATEPCHTVARTRSENFPYGAIWTITYLPKGYGPSREDRFVCAFAHRYEWGCFGICEGQRPPEIDVVVKALDDYARCIIPAQRGGAG